MPIFCSSLSLKKSNSQFVIFGLVTPSLENVYHFSISKVQLHHQPINCSKQWQNWSFSTIKLASSDSVPNSEMELMTEYDFSIKIISIWKSWSFLCILRTRSAKIRRWSKVTTTKTFYSILFKMDLMLENPLKRFG